MKKWLLAVLFAAVLVLGACGGGDDGAEEPADTDDAATEESTDDGGEAVDTAAGEDVYQNNCAACHGADLSGGAGPELTAVGNDYSEEELADIITNGKGSMPAQNVSGDDLDALTGWLAEQK